jgi:hypothetical protein
MMPPPTPAVHQHHSRQGCRTRNSASIQTQSGRTLTGAQPWRLQSSSQTRRRRSRYRRHARPSRQARARQSEATWATRGAQEIVPTAIPAKCPCQALITRRPRGCETRQESVDKPTCRLYDCKRADLQHGRAHLTYHWTDVSAAQFGLLCQRDGVIEAHGYLHAPLGPRHCSPVGCDGPLGQWFPQSTFCWRFWTGMFVGGMP